MLQLGCEEHVTDLVDLPLLHDVHATREKRVPLPPVVWQALVTFLHNIQCRRDVPEHVDVKDHIKEGHLALLAGQPDDFGALLLDTEILLLMMFLTRIEESMSSCSRFGVRNPQNSSGSSSRLFRSLHIMQINRCWRQLTDSNLSFAKCSKHVEVVGLSTDNVNQL